MKKKTFTKLFIFFSLCFTSLSIVSCNSAPVIESLKLATPKVTIFDNGVVTWDKVDHADLYEVRINDEFKATTCGYSYEIMETNPGNYTVNVIAFDTSEKYEHSNASESKTYCILVQKLDTPILNYDGNEITFDAIENASGYVLYADNIKQNEATFAEESGKITVNVPNLTSRKSIVEVKAISSSSSYSNSDFSNPIEYLQLEKRNGWDADGIDEKWDKENTAAILHIIKPEILVWVDVKGSQPATFENYVKVPKGMKAFAVTGYKPSSYGAAQVSIQVRRYNETEYTTLLINSNEYAITSNADLTTYYWTLPEAYQTGNVFVKITIGSSGNFQSQFVLREFGFEKNDHYIPPVIKTNVPVVLTNVTHNKLIKYNTSKGYMTFAETSDKEEDISVMFVPVAGKPDGYYRIKTQRGLYLSFFRTLREDNSQTEYVIETSLNTSLDAQIWISKPISSLSGKDTFTLKNYGYTDGKDPATGEQQYLVMACPYDHDNVGSWHDVSHTDLQFVISESSGTFTDDGKYVKSPDLDLTKPFITYFTGRNNVFTMNPNGYLTSGANITTVSDLTEYSWTFEDSGDGFYYIKRNNNNYLYAVYESGVYLIKESANKTNEAKFLWLFETRGGMLGYIGNKFVNQSGFIQYIVRNPDERIGFYTDLVAHYDQVLRITNI